MTLLGLFCTFFRLTRGYNFALTFFKTTYEVKRFLPLFNIDNQLNLMVISANMADIDRVYKKSKMAAKTFTFKNASEFFCRLDSLFKFKWR